MINEGDDDDFSCFLMADYWELHQTGSSWAGQFSVTLDYPLGLNICALHIQWLLEYNWDICAQCTYSAFSEWGITELALDFIAYKVSRRLPQASFKTERHNFGQNRWSKCQRTVLSGFSSCIYIAYQNIDAQYCPAFFHLYSPNSCIPVTLFDTLNTW